MSTASTVAVPEKAEAPETPKENFYNSTTGIMSWLLTTDHKRIGVLYLCSIIGFFVIGGIAAGLFRLELLTPEGDLVGPETYNRLFTTHGIMMIFFFVIPGVPAALGNFVLPIMLGAKDVAFPRVNLASWYIYWIGGIFTLLSLLLGGVDTGWTFYTPYSTTYSNSNVLLAGIGIFVTGFSSILTGLNFIVTTHKMRAPGLTWLRLPLFVWAHYATALVQILGTPVVAITVLLLAMERGLGLGIFDPNRGGDPVLFQHLFWFYSHPAVYVMILPAMGVVSEIIAAFSKQRIFGYNLVALSSLGIAILGFIVWGHHMYTSSQSVYVSMLFSILTMLIAIPTAVKMLNWTMTLYKGYVSFETPMMYALSFMGLFVIGGLTGLFLATTGTDLHLHDTYFVVAHFHYVMVGGMVTAFLGGLHFWWPKITGKMYGEFVGQISAFFVFIGFNFTFFPQFLLGYQGMPRRYYMYPEEFQILNVLSTAGATVLGIGYILVTANLLWSLFNGKVAGSNPWGAFGLEWETTSPPPTENFHTPPVVTKEAYSYERREVSVG